MGVFCWLILLLLCVLCVYVGRLAYLGYASSKTRPVQDEKKPEPPVEPEPIYYIVERKKRAAKVTYGDPQKIRFTKEKE